MSTAQDLCNQILKERDAAKRENREPFVVAISSEERVMMERYFGMGTGLPGCWPSHIAGVPIQVVLR